MPIPEDAKLHNDAIDFLSDAAQEIKKMPNESGELVDQLIVDPKQIYYETRIVDSNQFGGFVFELEELERMADLAYNNMTKERADIIAPQIIKLVKSFHYSIDGKSSETRRDKNNAQSSLVDKLVRNKQERIISLKGEVGHSLMDAIRGKNAEQESLSED